MNEMKQTTNKQKEVGIMRMRQKLVKVTSAVALIVFGSSFTACTESPFQPDKQEAVGSTESLAKRGGKNADTSASDSATSTETQNDNLSAVTTIFHINQ